MALGENLYFKQSYCTGEWFRCHSLQALNYKSSSPVTATS